LELLETRLDNVIYRLGLADSRPHARQMVQHGHFNVNGVATNISSYPVKAGDEITLHGASKNIKYFREIRAYMSERQQAPSWLTIDAGGNEGLVAKMIRRPERKDFELPLNEQLIVEYYSR
jgi:small subunit ribosomal protein S4